MAIKRIKVIIKGARRAKCELEDEKFNLFKRGDGVFEGTHDIDVEGELYIYAHVRGPASAAWSMQVFCDDEKKPFHEDNEKFNDKGFWHYRDQVECKC